MSRRDPKALPDDYDFHLVTSDRPIRGVDLGHPGQRPWDVIEEQQRWLYEAEVGEKAGQRLGRLTAVSAPGTRRDAAVGQRLAGWWADSRKLGTTRAEASAELSEITAGPPVMKRPGSLGVALLRELFEEEWTA
jgi:hypothetical protein